jgi:glucose-6-phosphate 1-dehydrogenase
MPAAVAGSEIVREIRTRILKPPGPSAMVIFGVTGDLSKRLLLPALYNLASQGLLPVGCDGHSHRSARRSGCARRQLAYEQRRGEYRYDCARHYNPP